MRNGRLGVWCQGLCLGCEGPGGSEKIAATAARAGEKEAFLTLRYVYKPKLQVENIYASCFLRQNVITQVFGIRQGHGLIFQVQIHKIMIQEI